MNYLVITFGFLLGIAIIFAIFYFSKKYFEFNSSRKLTSIILHEIKNNITVLKWHTELFSKKEDISKEEALKKLDSVIESLAENFRTPDVESNASRHHNDRVKKEDMMKPKNLKEIKESLDNENIDSAFDNLLLT